MRHNPTFAKLDTGMTVPPEVVGAEKINSEYLLPVWGTEIFCCERLTLTPAAFKESDAPAVMGFDMGKSFGKALGKRWESCSWVSVGQVQAAQHALPDVGVGVHPHAVLAVVDGARPVVDDGQHKLRRRVARAPQPDVGEVLGDRHVDRSGGVVGLRAGAVPAALDEHCGSWAYLRRGHPHGFLIHVEHRKRSARRLADGSVADRLPRPRDEIGRASCREKV